MKSLKLVSFFALSILSSVATTTIARAGDVVWWAPNWGEERARTLAQKFMAANPGTNIKIEVTVSNGLPERVLTALRSGTGPDIIEVQHGWVNGYAQSGLILPLDDTIQDRQDYVPAALDYVSWNGKLWAIPYRIETHGIIYNKDRFREASLDPDKPPKTWDELTACVESYHRAEESGRSGHIRSPNRAGLQ